MLPAPALQAAASTTTTTNAASAEMDPLQARQVRTGGRLVVAADAPQRDDQLIAIPSLRSALCSWRQTKTLNLSARLQRPAAQ
jgi:peroxiredoxin